MINWLRQRILGDSRDLLSMWQYNVKFYPVVLISYIWKLLSIQGSIKRY